MMMLEDEELVKIIIRASRSELSSMHSSVYYWASEASPHG